MTEQHMSLESRGDDERSDALILLEGPIQNRHTGGSASSPRLAGLRVSSPQGPAFPNPSSSLLDGHPNVPAPTIHSPLPGTDATISKDERVPPQQLHEQNSNETTQRVKHQDKSQPAEQSTTEYISSHPICSLLVCCRTGTKGLQSHQIQTVLESRFEDKEDFRNIINHNQNLISTDVQLFQALRDVYLSKMCGFWRRYFSLKTLREIRLLSFTPTSRPVIVPLDDFVQQEILYAFQNPSKVTTEHEWIESVFRLRQQDCRHSLEFVREWNRARIAMVGLIPLFFSVVLSVVWSIKGSGIADAFAIGSFILIAGSLLLALLAIITGIEFSAQSKP